MSEETKASTSNGVHEEENAEMSIYKKEACKVVTFRIGKYKTICPTKAGVLKNACLYFSL